MVDLIAKTPCDGLLPVTHGTVTLTEAALGPMFLLSPRQGQAAALSQALKGAHGLDWPAPGRMTAAADATCLWCGKDQAMLCGVAPDTALRAHGAMIDQSDAWAVVDLTGDAVANALARLVPLDMRAQAFPRGHTARSLLGHMTVTLAHLPNGAIRILAFRSMAATLVHELESAMSKVAARDQAR